MRRLRGKQAIVVGVLAVLMAGCASASAPAASTEAPAALPESTPAEAAATPSPLPSPTTAVAPTLAAGATRTDANGIEQVWVPAGSFQMGTDDATIQALLAQNPPSWVAHALPSEQPQHKVTLSQGYWIDKNEVTNAAFQAFVDAGGYSSQEFWSEEGWQWLTTKRPNRQPRAAFGGPDFPRAYITWYEADAYARWRGGRLPTEAEWEYAARGPQSPSYPWGNDWDASLANVVDSTAPQAVGSFPRGASWVGALDMAGNVMEWVNDWLDVDYYKSGEQTDPQGPAAGKVKVEKGGWWGSNPFVARSAYRHFEDPPDYGDGHIGFRVVSGEGVESTHR